jgi:threonylcarbamoyladenosine tRNA methylthiotransferase MtaB
VDEAGFAFCHVFPFSPRPGTPAARMPATPGAVIKERAARLRAAGAAAKARHLQGLVGQERLLLMERGGVGRTPCFTLARLDNAAHGTFVRARFTGVADGILTAERAT